MSGARSTTSGCSAADVDPDAVRVDLEIVAVERERADDHFRAPTSCPTLITVARLSDADGGRCSCSNARTRSSRVIAPRPARSGRRRAAPPTASASQCRPRLVPRCSRTARRGSRLPAAACAGRQTRQASRRERRRHTRAMHGSCTAIAQSRCRHAAAAGSSTTRAADHDRQHAALRSPAARHSLTRASARSANSCSTRAIADGVEAAQRLGRLPHLAEERSAEVDRTRCRACSRMIAREPGYVVAHERAGGAEGGARAERRRQRANHPPLERRQVVDRPVRRVLAGARRDRGCRRPLRCAESSAPRTAAPGRSCLRAGPATFSQFS